MLPLLGSSLTPKAGMEDKRLFPSIPPPAFSIRSRDEPQESFGGTGQTNKVVEGGKKKSCLFHPLSQDGNERLLMTEQHARGGNMSESPSTT